MSLPFNIVQRLKGISPKGLSPKTRQCSLFENQPSVEPLRILSPR